MKSDRFHETQNFHPWSFIYCEIQFSPTVPFVILGLLNPPDAKRSLQDGWSGKKRLYKTPVFDMFRKNMIFTTDRRFCRFSIKKCRNIFFLFHICNNKCEDKQIINNIISTSVTEKNTVFVWLIICKIIKIRGAITKYLTCYLKEIGISQNL